MASIILVQPPGLPQFKAAVTAKTARRLAGEEAFEADDKES